MSQFAFLQREWPGVFDSAGKAEGAVHADPRTACFYARRTLELAVNWAYKFDPSLKVPYQDNLSALIHEPSFKEAAGEAVFSKARVINALGNRAVHGHRAIPPEDALAAVRELFHVTYWLARTYGRTARPAPGLAFDPKALPKAAPAPKHTAEQLRSLEASLRERDEKLAALLADKNALDEELQRVRAEVADAKKAAAAQPDTHDYSEAATRDYFIDLLLKEAGWPLDQPRDRELQVSGMPNKEGAGFVDYVLWGDDGKPLGLVEAKRTRRDARVGQQQAKLYADCLEQQFGQRPVIFYSTATSTGSGTTNYPPRGPDELFSSAQLDDLVRVLDTVRSTAVAA
jgi:type I restriction enzyme R subunit